jgi:hypothetical protein
MILAGVVINGRRVGKGKESILRGKEDPSTLHNMTLHSLTYTHTHKHSKTVI